MPKSSPSPLPSRQLSYVVLLLTLVHVVSSLHSPSLAPVPGPAAADSSPVSSPPSPQPAPSPAPAESTAAPSPSRSAADLSHTGVLDDNAGGSGKPEGTSFGRKAGVILAVVVCAALVVVGGIVYRKRRENIRRQQYAYSGRGEIQL